MPRKPAAKILARILGAAFVVAAVAFLFLFHPAPEPLPEVSMVRPARTEVVESARKLVARSFSGRVQAAGRVELAFRVSGPLVELPIRRGQEVEQGALLAQIDPRDFRVRLALVTSRIEEARAQLTAMERGERREVVEMRESELAAAQAELDNARVERERRQTLVRQGVVSQSELDQAQLRFDRAEQQVRRAQQSLGKAREGARAEDLEAMEATIRGLEAQHRQAANALDDTSLRAPFAGRVAVQHVENYQEVQAGQFIVSLQDLSRVEVVADIPESFLILARKDYVESLLVGFESLPGRQFEAVFEEIETTADPQTQTFAVTVQMPPPEGVNLFPGMPATLQIHVNAAAQAGQDDTLVPVSAIFSDPEGRPNVWIVDPEDLSVRRRRVRIDEPTGNRVAVSEGLEDGEEIVTAGVHLLYEGMKVRRLENRPRESR